MPLNALKIFDDRLDVVRVEHEDRHVRMPGDDSFGERLGKIVDRVFGGKGAEGRRFLVRAVALLADRVAARTVSLTSTPPLSMRVFSAALAEVAFAMRRATPAASPALTALSPAFPKYPDGTLASPLMLASMISALSRTASLTLVKCALAYPRKKACSPRRRLRGRSSRSLLATSVPR